jgi:protein phosphatase PTC1
LHCTGIGDRLLKRYVIPDPDIVRMEIEEDDCFAVLATDGLWDVMRNSEVGFFLNACNDAQEAANVLVKEAFERRTMDNVTVLVVDLRKGQSATAKVCNVCVAVAMPVLSFEY